jgi:hypothetical protein
MLALLGPKPRPLDDDIWAKLLWAGLNLTIDDLPVSYFQEKNGLRAAWYPVEIMRALTIVWLLLACGGMRFCASASGVYDGSVATPLIQMAVIDLLMLSASSTYQSTRPQPRSPNRSTALWGRQSKHGNAFGLPNPRFSMKRQENLLTTSL